MSVVCQLYSIVDYMVCVGEKGETDNADIWRLARPLAEHTPNGVHRAYILYNIATFHEMSRYIDYCFGL